MDNRQSMMESQQKREQQENLRRIEELRREQEVKEYLERDNKKNSMRDR